MIFRPGASDSHHAMGSWRNLFWVCWRGETLASAVVPMRRFIRQLIKDYPDGIGMLAIVEERASPPDSEARRAIGKLFNSIGDDVLVSAVVFEGTGFRASFVRSVVTGLTLVANQPFPHRVFPKVEAAALWLGELLPATELGKATTSEIIGAAGAMRETFGREVTNARVASEA